MADTYISKNTYAFDEKKNADCWNYEVGCVMKAMEALWRETGDRRYFDYIKNNIDYSVSSDGVIRYYNLSDYNVDMVNTGKALFVLNENVKDRRYVTALKQLRLQMKGHPRTSEGGFWHKKVYPYQMWLDGLYMVSPLLAEYAAEFNEPELFDDVANQLLLAERHTRDPRNGLLYHAWDEKKELGWADGETGRSPHAWSRAIGWYMMAVVDILDFLPIDHPKRGEIIGLFERLVIALGNHQDAESGVWFQITDMPDRKGNYLEASGSCMFVYAIAKGLRLGYLSHWHERIASKGWEGILKTFVTENADGSVNLESTCSGAGLGRHPERGDYRDGSFEYYVGEAVIRNDRKGISPFILAAIEMEKSAKG
jgi:unsaturated rhamnogalacturonyl hydrolase